MKLLLVPALLYIIGSLFIPLFKDKLRKIYVLSLAVLGIIEMLLIKPGTIYKFSFLNFTIIPLHADKLSLFVGYIFVIIGFFALLYTIHINKSIFQIVGLLYLGSALGVVFAGDFLTVYIFWELLALASTGLILFNKEAEARAAAFRYLIMHLIGGLFLLGGIWVYYYNTGSLLVTQLSAGLPFILIIIGVGINAAFILLHTWLPDSYPKAPYYASIFMSVFTTKTAVYFLARVAPGWTFIAYMGAAMAIFGVTMALMQNNARKLLSYHIISQVGYMVAAIGIGTAVGVNGAMFHLFNNILYKTILFMAVGAVIYVLDEENLEEMGGLAKKMPVTTFAVIIASLSITGMPLFNGFISKGLIFEAAHPHDIIYLMLELGAVGTFLSFLKFSYFGFLRPNKKMSERAHEAPWNMTVAMGALAVACVVTGVFPGLIEKILPFAVEGEGFYNIETIMGTAQLFIVSLIAFTLGRHEIFVPHKRITFDFDSIYIPVVESLVAVSTLSSNLNDWWEKTTEKIPVVLGALKQPTILATNYLSDIFTSLWIDIWLFDPTAHLHIAKIAKEESPLVKFFLSPFGILIKFLDTLGNSISRLAAGFDKSILDKASQGMFANIFFNVEEFSTKANRISSLSTKLDRFIIDGFINGIAVVFFYVGERTRRIQTGLVQNYALVIICVVAVLIIVLSFLSLKGGF